MDNAYLNGPQGSMLNIGSWFQVDAPPDYGARDLIQQQYAQNALADGAQFAYEISGKRTMRFPLLVASGGAAGLSLDSIEAWLRTMARPSAYIDLQPDGVPTAEMVRFDVIGGRVNHDPWSLPLQRVDRRKLTVELDTQPFGYWPTWITLASVGWPGVQTPFRTLIRGASVIGDVAAPVRLVLDAGNASSTAISSGPAGSYSVDFLAWSLSGGPSYPPSTIAAAPSGIFGAFSDAFASSLIGTPTVARLGLSGTLAVGGAPSTLQWEVVTQVNTPTILRGQARLFMWTKLSTTGGTTGVPLQVMSDVGPSGDPLATANSVASIVPGVGSGGGHVTAYGNSPSSGYVLYDLGERAFGNNASEMIRLYYTGPSVQAAPLLHVAGYWPLPLDGPAGILPRGLVLPTTTGAWLPYNRLDLDAVARTIDIKSGGSSVQGIDVTTQPRRRSALAFYRGGLPFVGASDQMLNVIAGTRPVGTGNNDAPMITGVSGIKMAYSLAYRPRFQFLKGL